MQKKPFDDDDEEEIITPVKSKVGIKISNKQSMFANTPKKPSVENFEKQAITANNKSVDYAQHAAKLTASYMKMMADKTVTENKTIFEVDIEKEIISNLVKLGIEINVDELQEEGMGSIGLVSLLFQTVISQRDKINYIEYAINLLNKKLIALELASVDTKKNNE